MSKKKREADNEYTLSSVLSKPVAQEEKERILSEKKKAKTKKFLSAAVIVVMAAVVTILVTVVKPWNYIPDSPTKVLRNYIAALNTRDYDTLKGCLSPLMREAHEELYGDVVDSSIIFNTVFNSELKAQFGDDVRFDVTNIKENNTFELDDGLYFGVNYKADYGADKMEILTCDLLTIGSLSSDTAPTNVVLIHIDGEWYIEALTQGAVSDTAVQESAVSSQAE